MRILPSLTLATLALALAACGGDDGGAAIDASTIDSPPGAIDAAVDAPAATSGLGHICQGPMDCPAAAPLCLGPAGAMSGFCSANCLTTMVTTNATGGITAINPPLASGDPACVAIFSAPVGTAACFLRVMPSGPLPNNATTTATMACAIRCGVNDTCPSGLTCVTAGTSKICQPM